MDYKNLREQSIELLLERVTGLEALATRASMQSVMALIARCTIEISSSLNNAALKVETVVESISGVTAQITAAANRIQDTATEINNFNASTTELTNQIIKLNRRLFWVTLVIAVATLLGALAAVASLFKNP